MKSSSLRSDCNGPDCREDAVNAAVRESAATQREAASILRSLAERLDRAAQKMNDYGHGEVPFSELERAHNE